MWVGGCLSVGVGVYVCIHVPLQGFIQGVAKWYINHKKIAIQTKELKTQKN